MKKKLLAAVVLVLLVLACTGEGLVGLALPFTLAADGLRWLSLSGGAGNLAALVLYGALCLSPLALFRKNKEDWLLVVCSGVLFYVMYLLINPGMMPGILRNEVGELTCAGTVYSIWLCWAVLRMLRVSDGLGTASIYRALRIFLLVCAGSLVLLGTLGTVPNLLERVQEIQNANTMPGLDLTATYLFAGLDHIASAVEYMLDALVLFLAAGLVKELEADPYSGESAAAGERVAMWCRRTLGTVTVTATGLNLGQLLLASQLRCISGEIRIPVFSLGLVFVTLAVTRLLGQGKRLKDENDLYI